jgi:quercetin dioxygenase-like cupin family protein
VRHIPATSRPATTADPETFVHRATTQALLGRDDGLPLLVYQVSFEAGARMNWHRHDGPQLLLGLSGRCVVENRAGNRVEIEEGDLVVVEAGEEHWHGAPSDHLGTHLAINLGQRTEWLERPPSS